MIGIKRALLSVSDKSGIAEFARGLHEHGVQLISTGGTAAFLQKEGLPVTPVSEVTAMPEMLDGRVKTLHPKIHGGLLAQRDNPSHQRQVAQYDIPLIDLVVVNLYPFVRTVSRPGVTRAEAVEQIDIGGPTMLRSAAKNAGQVVVVCDPLRYPELLEQLRQQGGISEETSRELAAEVFSHTSAYDQAIAQYLRPGDPDSLPAELTVRFRRVQQLRYGENPHQPAAFYRQLDCSGFSLADLRQLHGKELSFNNLLDIQAAWQLVREFQQPAACVVKHNNPCGVAVAVDAAQAFAAALAGDRLSAFGGIVGINRPVEEPVAAALLTADFLECVVAPGFSEAAVQRLQVKKNLRLVVLPFAAAEASAPLDFKRVDGGLLVQRADTGAAMDDPVRIVTRCLPDPAQQLSLRFAWQVVKSVKSNAIVLVQDTRTVGIGAGQMSRVDSVHIAVRKAAELARGAVLASDAFFPKADAVEEAARAGVSAIIQPGGSIRDEEVIAAAEKAGIPMLVTGIRHFKH